MSDQSAEVVTDPRYIYSNDMNVLAYRMGLVETALGDIGSKLDNIAAQYPTNTVLELMLKPMREDIKDLQHKREQEASSKVRDQTQRKMLTYAAVIGPAATFIITLIMASVFGAFPNGQ